MVNFKELNWDHFNGSLDVEHFIGFLQYLAEDKEVSKDEMTEMIISNIGSHVEPYKVDYKNKLTELIERLLLDLAKKREINLNENIDNRLNEISIDSNTKEKEDLFLYLLCKMLKNNQLNMIVNHGVSQEDTQNIQLVMSALDK